MLQKFLDKIRPSFQDGGKLHAFRSVFEGMESFLVVPSTTSRCGASIHDAIDSKRIMSFVVIALLPALLFGMFNIGHQHFTFAAQSGCTVSASWFDMFLYGFLVMLPKIVVSYVVGLGIEFVVAQWKHEEIQEGYLVTGIIIPMIMPVNCPLWMLALACAFAVIVGKEIFGGTGMNIFNPALLARAFLFFSYPTKMSGDTVWVANDTIFGMGYALTDGTTAATPLGLVAQKNAAMPDLMDAVTGFIPGSIGETSVIAIAIGAIILLWAGIASWRTMLSVFVGGALMSLLFSHIGMSPLSWTEQLCYGGFAFGAVFMATDPVTSCRTETGKYIYGFLIGVMAIVFRVMNPGYAEGMMLAILLMNMFASTIDHFVVEANINKRAKRANKK